LQPTAYLRAFFAPMASAMMAVTKLLMLTPSLAACLVCADIESRRAARSEEGY
jgi:hypothetical protein